MVDFAPGKVGSRLRPCRDSKGRHERSAAPRLTRIVSTFSRATHFEYLPCRLTIERHLNPGSSFHWNHRFLGSCVHKLTFVHLGPAHLVATIIKGASHFELPDRPGTLLALSTGPRLMGPSIRRFGGVRVAW